MGLFLALEELALGITGKRSLLRRAPALSICRGAKSVLPATRQALDTLHVRTRNEGLDRR
jgi:hypothetical protein